MAEPVTTNIEPKTPASDDTPHDALLLPRLALLDAGKIPLTSWTPSSDEEQRIFRVWKGFTLAERTKDTVSWIWDYGVEIQSEASRRWICMPCVRQKASSPQSYESRGTQNAEHHLWKSHGYWDPSGRRRTPLQTKEGRKAFASITDLMGLKRLEPNDQALANNLIRRFDQAEFQKLVVNWIVESQQSFRQVEHPRLRQIFEYLNPAVRIKDAHVTAKTIQSLAIQQFERHRDAVQHALRRSPGQIHIAFDGARTRNRHALYGVTAVFRDEDNQLRKLVLGIPELVERHSGENIAAEILDIIRSFGIEDKVGYFTLDNAANNDTAMREIAQELHFDPVRRRVRCVGHILNLVVKSLLFGKDVEAFEDTVAKGEALARAAHDTWMRRGPVGKAHNFAIWVHRSDVLTQLLRQIQQDSYAAADDAEVGKQRPVDVVIDNDTRWLSQYYMIKRLLRLQPFYEEFIAKAKRIFRDGRRGEVGRRFPPCLEESSFLTENDWAVLRTFDEILSDFHVVVQALQGDGQPRCRASGIRETFGSMTDVLEAFEFLLSKLEDAKSQIETHPEPEHFGINVNLGWMKLDKYYNTLRDTPVYYAAAALHPGLRWTYFDEIWGRHHPEWVEEAKQIVQQLWSNEYSNLQITVASTADGPALKKQKTVLSSFDRYRNRHRQSNAPTAGADEYARWQASMSELDRDVADPVEYWHLKRFEYPKLSRMALDVMTVPAMSAECERLFSAAGLMEIDVETTWVLNIVAINPREGFVDSTHDSAAEFSIGKLCSDTMAAAALAGVTVARIAFLCLRLQTTTLQTQASLASDILSIIGSIAAILLSFLHHQRSLRPSTLLSLFLSAQTILDIPRARTLWLFQGNTAEAAVMTMALITTSTALLLESLSKKSIILDKDIDNAPEQHSGLWARTAFVWLTTTFYMGYSSILDHDDLPFLDTKLHSQSLRDKLATTWTNYNHKAPHSLLKASLRTNILSFSFAVPPRICKSAFYFAQPFLIDATITYVQAISPNRSFGQGLIGAWALVFLGIACSNSLTSYQTLRFVTRIKGGLTALVYQHTIITRAVDLGPTTAIALMGTDIERIGFNLLQIHEIWASIVEIAVAIWLLERQVSIACLAPVVVILAAIAINTPISKAAKKAQVGWIERVQERLRITSSMLDDVQAVKMLGLSIVMSDIIQRLRRVEIETSKVFRKLLVSNVLLSECPQNISPLATFATTVIITLYRENGSLLTAQAFTSIALINLLTVPVIQLVQLMPQLQQCIGSFERIQEYCNYAPDDNKKDDSSHYTTKTAPSISLDLPVAPREQENGQHKRNAITLQNSSFSWDKAKPPFLKSINMKVLNGSILCCTGPVGSGKTMLLESMLGEKFQVHGSTSHSASPIAYCPQQTWLENGTIRSNITGILDYEQEWYRKVTSACGLDTDFKALEHGDLTVIGSKGLNLSGGQKQRIALARAAFSRMKIYFLDDVFSGMDARTVDHISQRLLGSDGLLSKGSTVILTTHNHKLLSFADTVIALEDGRIVESGTPQRLLACNGVVANLRNSIQDDCCDLGDGNSEDATVQQVGSLVAESLPSTPEYGTGHDNVLDTRRKQGDWSVYSYYLSSSGYSIVSIFLASMAFWVFCTEFSTVWLKWWSGANEMEANKDVGTFMGVYAFLSLFGVVAIGISCWFGIINIISNSAISLHSDLLASTIRKPLWFFTKVDTGTLTNRFRHPANSQDMELIDMNLPLVMINYIATALSVAAKGIILLVFSRYLAAMTPFVIVLLYLLQSFYLKTSRQVRLLEIEAKAPLYTHFIESVSGASTIRAFGWQSEYRARNSKLIDRAQRAAYLQTCIQTWLGFALDVLIAVIATVLVAVVATWKDKFSGGNVGVALVMNMTFSSTLMRMMKTWTTMESSVGAVARVKNFITERESEDNTAGTVEVAQDWPMTGRIEFKDLVAAHSPTTEPVLKGLTLTIKPSEHIAVCGRSGCGKTSTILALLRLIDTRQGKIMIDDVDISHIRSDEVRTRLNVVPQDPLLIPGTIRFNIDPLGKSSDNHVIRALERVQLWSIISELPGKLSAQMNADVWSAGQKQLLCLARAMVRRSSVLILDEATSSVDSKMEALMQDIIDDVFKSCTVVAVMHRLSYITRYDKVAVLDEGQLMEYNAPEVLLAQDSRLAQLYRLNM
ncbi:ABC transporter [Cordyceps fumosorosea ARSEF 2679]|uniref:ABC transporter n=2 Tax=Cordyceps fumosorosea (strain ARSEF 2679) TaxID=1081104 RepID=A0A162J340_CORFA|nr:ABC transporter [Cordyceps fumosorosea ARSEF 2679]OAA38788.1 ABC transporter [Cordyceps fumosorosea ARSEF 2679]